MYNYKIKKFDPLSSFKFGIFFSVAVSVISIILIFFYFIYNSIIGALGPALFINVFLNNMIKLFFYIISFGIGSLVFSGACSLSAYVFNFSVVWSEGLKIELEEYVEENSDEQNEAKTETAAASDNTSNNEEVVQ